MLKHLFLEITGNEDNVQYRKKITEIVVFLVISSAEGKIHQFQIEDIKLGIFFKDFSEIEVLQLLFLSQSVTPYISLVNYEKTKAN